MAVKADDMLLLMMLTHEARGTSIATEHSSLLAPAGNQVQGQVQPVLITARGR
jgi:hypothetical protein